MKKIGIVTFNRAHNYGAMLQLFALNKILKSHNCFVVDYYSERLYKNYKIFRILKNVALKDKFRNIFSNIYFLFKNLKRYFSFNSFLNSRFNLTKKIYDNNDFVDVTKTFDILITGSDQVWNPLIVGELSDIFTLNFNFPIKKISYAASVGNIKQIDSLKDDFTNKISQLDYISVREDDANNKLSTIISKPIETVLDPTLLLTKNEWENEIRNINFSKKEYILAYVVEEDKDYIDIVNYLSEKTNLKVIYFDKRNRGYNNPLKSAYTSGPLEFVSLIKNAEYVVATSFHATIFSIIFNKKFFIVPHKVTGSRVTSILEKLNITDRIFNSLDEFKKIDFNFESDWNSINKKLEIERQKSIEWLNNAIEK